MRHATDGDLDRLEPLLAALRGRDGLRERRRGAFLHRSRAFLHFHGHGDQLYADVRLDGVEFERREVTTAADQARLLAEIDACLDGARLSQPAPRRRQSSQTTGKPRDGGRRR